MGLYIHVPFCSRLCSYCHFVRTDRHNAATRLRFVDGVVREFELRRDRCRLLRASDRLLQTAYVGGGTPSCLEPDLMARLVEGTVGRLATTENLELTAEANPESLTPELASCWRSLGINRISLGVQSLQPDVLDLLGRHCAPETARWALSLACEVFPRVSADWIIGPALTRDRLLAELTEAVDLGVDHFSLYILEVHSGTTLAERIHAGRVRLPSDAHTEALYLAAGDHLATLGIRQYEVANFARPGCESRHNQRYWQRRPWLALGPGAHGYWGRRRYANEPDLQAWSAALAVGQLPESEIDPLSLPARLLERVILSLRTCQGVPLAWLPQTGLDFQRGQDEGLWTFANNHLVLTARGFLRIDTLEETFARAMDP